MFIPIGDNIRHRTFPIIPCVLIAVNVLVFSHQIRIVHREEGDRKKIGKAIEKHYKTWGLVPEDVKEEGQVLGLLTHMFMHGGLMHLIGNMLVLWAFAVSLEVGLGSFTLLGFYILWGLIGGLAHAGSDWTSDMPLVGASGAIAGLIGAYTVLYGYDAKIRCLLWLFWHPIRVNVPAMAFGLSWIGLQLWDASNDPEGMSGIAWYAHIGGFFAGAVTAWLFGGDTDRDLHRDDQGNLTFQDKEEEKKKRADRRAEAIAQRHRDPAVEAAIAAHECPYCHMGLENSTEISPGLRRCANENCARLVYDEVALAE